VPTVRNGWRLLEYAAFTSTLNALANRAAALQANLPPDAYRQHPAVKLLARVRQIIEIEIPRDPNRPDYRLKGGLARWRRVKFNGRYRLFFRFDTKVKIIAYCWLNDEKSLRKEGAGTDPYEVFARMVANARPPETWAELEKTCTEMEPR